MANWLDKSFYNIDLNIAKLFSNIQTKFMNGLMELISFLGESGILLIMLGLILCIFIKTRRMGATILFSLAFSAILTSVIVKPLVARARPYSNEELEFFKWWINAGKHLEDSYSFPSGHVTASMAFSLSVFATSKNKKWTSFIFIFPILMTSSRIYLMVHYFSDCLFGLISGAIGTIIGYIIVKLLFEKTKGKFNNFINNFNLILFIKKLFNKNKKINN